MKIVLAASAGGHLTQIQTIFTKEIVGNNQIMILTEKNKKTKELSEQKYFFKPMGNNPFNYLVAVLRCIRFFKKEKIKLIITTGAEIGLVSVIAGKILGIKTMFIETVIRVKTPTVTGKIAYFFSDIFLVQNQGMEKKYGKRAKYVGGII